MIFGFDFFGSKAFNVMLDLWGGGLYHLRRNAQFKTICSNLSESNFRRCRKYLDSFKK